MFFVSIFFSLFSSYIAVALESADPLNPNLLRREVGEALNDLQTFVLQNMTIELPDGSYHFGNDICPKLALCPISNTIVQIFFDAYFSEKVSAQLSFIFQYYI